MSKEKKESIFKRIFSSNQACCSVDIEEVKEDEYNQDNNFNNNEDADLPKK